MKITSASHLDHGLSPRQVQYIREKFADRDAFFIESFELPSHLGEVSSALYGPIVGDPPVEDARDEVRGGRGYPSRVVDRPLRQTRTVTVIAGPHEGEPCVLYTAFGGPLTPQEPGDPSCKDRAASEAFWLQHALATGRKPKHGRYA